MLCCAVLCSVQVEHLAERTEGTARLECNKLARLKWASAHYHNNYYKLLLLFVELFEYLCFS